ncbi:MAG: hypothetical protein ABIZ80_01495, partial [Bryobacteraceae bacterium]
DRFGNRLRAGLEKSLNRPVRIGKVRFNLFRVGFSINDVIIGEDPAFGIEPFAYMESLEVSPQISSLWTRRLEFSSLRLSTPSVNLVKVDGRWNFEPLLTPGLITAMPKIAVREGRINFKFGDVKSVFYVTNTDLDLTAVSTRGGATNWQVVFTGEPARTDRARFGLGNLRGSGQVVQESAAPHRVQMDIELEKSALGELSALILGRDAGIHGIASSRVHLAGPVEDIRITGRMQLEELHRWDQMPMKGAGWPIDFRGRWNLTGQRLEMESHAAVGVPLPVSIRYRVSNYLSHPRWGLGLTWNQFPAEPLLPVARHMGAAIPAGWTLSGTLDGAVSWSADSALQGQVALQDAVVAFPDSPQIRCDRAGIVFQGNRVHLNSALVRTAGPASKAESEATLEADYGWAGGELDLTVASESMSISAIRSHAARLPAPFLESLSGGVWRGKLRYERGPQVEEGWSGQVQLTAAEIPLTGVADPLKVKSASAKLDKSRLVIEKLQASIGKMGLEGEYRFDPKATRPGRFRIAMLTADAAELERLLMPTLRRGEGFIARTLGIGRPVLPDWLASRHMEGTIRIGLLTAGNVSFTDLQSRMRWNGGDVKLTETKAKVENGSVAGEGQIDLRGREPLYRFGFQLEAMDWNSGKIDADGVIETSGSGRSLLSGLRAEGTFTAESLEWPAASDVKSASGNYRVDVVQYTPRLRFSEIRMMVGDDLFVGKGASQDDGRLLVQLSSGAKQLRVTGTLAQLKLE